MVKNIPPYWFDPGVPTTTTSTGPHVPSSLPPLASTPDTSGDSNGLQLSDTLVLACSLSATLVIAGLLYCLILVCYFQTRRSHQRRQQERQLTSADVLAGGNGEEGHDTFLVAGAPGQSLIGNGYIPTHASIKLFLLKQSTCGPGPMEVPSTPSSAEEETKKNGRSATSADESPRDSPSISVHQDVSMPAAPTNSRNDSTTAAQYENLTENDQTGTIPMPTTEPINSSPPEVPPYLDAIKRSSANSCFHLGDAEDLCVMCVSNYRELEIIRELPCGHFFHRDCIDPWLRVKAQCPTCRLPAFVGVYGRAGNAAQVVQEAALN